MHIKATRLYTLAELTDEDCSTLLQVVDSGLNSIEKSVPLNSRDKQHYSQLTVLRALLLNRNAVEDTKIDANNTYDDYIDDK